MPMLYKRGPGRQAGAVLSDPNAPNERFGQPAQRVPNPPLAALLIIIASAFIAGATLFAKMLGTGMLGPALHPLQISHGRFLFGFLLLGAGTLVIKPHLTKPRLIFHIGRTLCGWGGVSFMFAAIAFISLTDATAISFLNPVFAMLLAIPLLGEHVGRWRYLAAAIALTGGLILLRPGPDSFQFGALFAWTAAIMLGLELILIKKLTKLESLFQILLINNFLGALIATVAMLAVMKMPTGDQWLALAALGVMMACAQIFFINAMARADVSFVTPLSYATLVFAALFDSMVFGVIPDWVSLLGAATIIAGAVLLVWREARAKA